MKNIALALPLAASLLLTHAAEAASPRAELLAGVAHQETLIEVRHNPGARHAGSQATRHDYRDDYRDDNRRDKRGRNGDYQYRQARRYAAEALDQAREARQLGFYPDHPRWSLNFERHFNWALGVSERDLQREHHRRAAKLREWRRQAAYSSGRHSGYRKPY